MEVNAGAYGGLILSNAFAFDKVDEKQKLLN
jgi:hypothetical protein